MGRPRSESNSIGDGVYRRPSGIFELRYPIPPDVAHAFLSKQGQPLALKVVSLGTRDDRQARINARKERDGLAVQIHRARSESVEDRLNRYLQGLYREGTEALPALRADQQANSRERLFGPKPSNEGGLKERLRTLKLKPIDEAAWVADRINWGRIAAGNDSELSPEMAVILPRFGGHPC